MTLLLVVIKLLSPFSFTDSIRANQLLEPLRRLGVILEVVENICKSQYVEFHNAEAKKLKNEKIQMSLICPFEEWLDDFDKGHLEESISSNNIRLPSNLCRKTVTNEGRKLEMLLLDDTSNPAANIKKEMGSAASSPQSTKTGTQQNSTNEPTSESGSVDVGVPDNTPGNASEQCSYDEDKNSKFSTDVRRDVSGTVVTGDGEKTSIFDSDDEEPLSSIPRQTVKREGHHIAAAVISPKTKDKRSDSCKMLEKNRHGDLTEKKLSVTRKYQPPSDVKTPIMESGKKTGTEKEFPKASARPIFGGQVDDIITNIMRDMRPRVKLDSLDSSFSLPDPPVTRQELNDEDKDEKGQSIFGDVTDRDEPSVKTLGSLSDGMVVEMPKFLLPQSSVGFPTEAVSNDNTSLLDDLGISPSETAEDDDVQEEPCVPKIFAKKHNMSQSFSVDEEESEEEHLDDVFGKNASKRKFSQLEESSTKCGGDYSHRKNKRDVFRGHFESNKSGRSNDQSRVGVEMHEVKNLEREGTPKERRKSSPINSNCKEQHVSELANSKLQVSGCRQSLSDIDDLFGIISDSDDEEMCGGNKVEGSEIIDECSLSSTSSSEENFKETELMALENMQKSLETDEEKKSSGKIKSNSKGRSSVDIVTGSSKEKEKSSEKVDSNFKTSQYGPCHTSFSEAGSTTEEGQESLEVRNSTRISDKIKVDSQNTPVASVLLSETTDGISVAKETELFSRCMVNSGLNGSQGSRDDSILISEGSSKDFMSEDSVFLEGTQNETVLDKANKVTNNEFSGRKEVQPPNKCKTLTGETAVGDDQTVVDGDISVESRGNILNEKKGDVKSEVSLTSQKPGGNAEEASESTKNSSESKEPSHKEENMECSNQQSLDCKDQPEEEEKGSGFPEEQNNASAEESKEEKARETILHDSKGRGQKRNDIKQMNCKQKMKEQPEGNHDGETVDLSTKLEEIRRQYRETHLLNGKCLSKGATLHSDSESKILENLSKDSVSDLLGTEKDMALDEVAASQFVGDRISEDLPHGKNHEVECGKALLEHSDKTALDSCDEELEISTLVTDISDGESPSKSGVDAMCENTQASGVQVIEEHKGGGAIKDSFMENIIIMTRSRERIRRISEASSIASVKLQQHPGDTENQVDSEVVAERSRIRTRSSSRIASRLEKKEEHDETEDDATVSHTVCKAAVGKSIENVDSEESQPSEGSEKRRRRSSSRILSLEEKRKAFQVDMEKRFSKSKKAQVCGKNLPQPPQTETEPQTEEKTSTTKIDLLSVTKNNEVQTKELSSNEPEMPDQIIEAKKAEPEPSCDSQPKRVSFKWALAKPQVPFRPRVQFIKKQGIQNCRHFDYKLPHPPVFVIESRKWRKQNLSGNLNPLDCFKAVEPAFDSRKESFEIASKANFKSERLSEEFRETPSEQPKSPCDFRDKEILTSKGKKRPICTRRPASKDENAEETMDNLQTKRSVNLRSRKKPNTRKAHGSESDDDIQVTKKMKLARKRKRIFFESSDSEDEPEAELTNLEIKGRKCSKGKVAEKESKKAPSSKRVKSQLLRRAVRLHKKSYYPKGTQPQYQHISGENSTQRESDFSVEPQLRDSPKEKTPPPKEKPTCRFLSPLKDASEIAKRLSTNMKNQQDGKRTTILLERTPLALSDVKRSMKRTLEHTSSLFSSSKKMDDSLSQAKLTDNDSDDSQKDIKSKRKSSLDNSRLEEQESSYHELSSENSSDEETPLHICNEDESKKRDENNSKTKEVSIDKNTSSRLDQRNGSSAVAHPGFVSSLAQVGSLARPKSLPKIEKPAKLSVSVAPASSDFVDRLFSKGEKNVEKAQRNSLEQKDKLVPNSLNLQNSSTLSREMPSTSTLGGCRRTINAETKMPHYSSEPLERPVVKGDSSTSSNVLLNFYGSKDSVPSFVESSQKPSARDTSAESPLPSGVSQPSNHEGIMEEDRERNKDLTKHPLDYAQSSEDNSQSEDSFAAKKHFGTPANRVRTGDDRQEIGKTFCSYDNC